MRRVIRFYVNFCPFCVPSGLLILPPLLMHQIRLLLTRLICPSILYEEAVRMWGQRKHIRRSGGRLNKHLLVVVQNLLHVQASVTRRV